MSRTAPLTASADRTLPMPASNAARRDAIAAAVATLRQEERRLQRIGLERPMARCHEDLRYWEFLAGLFALPAEKRSSSDRRSE